MEQRKGTVLEKSTNTHQTQTAVEVIQSNEKMNTIQLRVFDESLIVEHGHHNTVATEKETINIVKIVQQELNPITKRLQNSFD